MHEPTPDRGRSARTIAVPADVRRHLFLVVAAVVALALALAFVTRVGAEEARTLDEVEIEGEVRLPQVLFITSRDADRPLDWLEAWTGPTAAEIASAAWVAPRIHLLAPSPSPGAGSEIEEIEPREIPSVTEEDAR